MEYVWLLLSAAAGYLIGSVNLSIVFSRLRGKDIRSVGSGNAGATNVLRTMGKGFAAAVFVFDVLKGFLPAFLLMSRGKEYAACAYAVFAVVGHCYPLYFKFKGGKGVSTAIGALCAIALPAAAMTVVEFVFVLLLFRYVSLASVVAAFNLPFFAYHFAGENAGAQILAVVCLALLVIWKHRANIVRIREGCETPLFGKKS